ncbi:50S ribosomal protein L19 [Patescibacteria group bacterium]|nr:50S ribosomal protein L19 [Patescibacteria group bacterium]MBU1028909.1 50S ribosomal protein L19 [Patescibacteria group bacterium]MBU1916075.1 50S ribosomal protein L19 [Patescibacteria group bacterium]
MADEEKKIAEDGQTEEAPQEEVAAEESQPSADNNNEGSVAEEPEEATAEEVVIEEVEPAEAPQKIEPGMVIRVHVKIKDVTPRGDERERIQVFEGTVIAKNGQDQQSTTITVRKMSGGIGVERIFPLKMPAIEKIEIVKQFRTRRSKLYFLRDRKFKKRLKEVTEKKK